MKKLITLVLAFAFVLGLASVASADFTISGQFCAYYYFDTEAASDAVRSGFIPLLSGDNRVELVAKGAYGPVTGDIKLRYKLDGTFETRTATGFYKFNDTYALGVIWDKSGDLDWYKSLVDPDLHFETKNSLPWVKGTFTSNEFTAMALYNMDQNDISFLVGSFNWTLGDVVLSAGAAYRNPPAPDAFGEYIFVPGLKWKVSDVFSLAAEVWYGDAWINEIGGNDKWKSILPPTAKYAEDTSDDSGKQYLTNDTLFGINAAYKVSKKIDSYVGLFYNYDHHDIEYWKGSLKFYLTEKFDLYASYIAEDYYVNGLHGRTKIGADLALDGKYIGDSKAYLNFEYDTRIAEKHPEGTINADYPWNDTAFGVKLIIKF